MESQFLNIFYKNMHKLNLNGVKFVCENKNFGGKTYYKFIGQFQLSPPLYFYQNELYKLFEQRKVDILNILQVLQQQKSNCITHKYSKKIRLNGKVEGKKQFQFVFDVVPKNVIDFSFRDDKLILYVIGWGM